MNAHMPLAKPQQPFVTHHAVARFCQRVLDVSLPAERLTPRSDAARHCAAAGLQPEQIAAMILTAKVCLEWRMGKDWSGNGVFCAVFSGGAVATICTPEQIDSRFPAQKAKRCKLRERTRKQFVRQLHQQSRRSA